MYSDEFGVDTDKFARWYVAYGGWTRIAVTEGVVVRTTGNFMLSDNLGDSLSTYYLKVVAATITIGHPDMVNNEITFVGGFGSPDIFRLGYGLVLKLRKRAKAWRTQGWFANNRLALSFWDEYLVGMIGGLLVDRPRFFDNYETEGLYREFASLADIKAAHRALKQAMAFDDILSCMGVATADLPEGFFITYKNLLLTLWARSELHMAARPEPVPVERFKAFYQKLWEEGRHPPHIREEMKSRFLTWLSGESGFTEGEIADTLGKALESLFAEIGGEYGGVAAKDLDPRFVPHFLLCRQKG